MLDHLRANDFAKLRKYKEHPGCKFTTWLTGVVQNSCIDLIRHRYGRTRDESKSEEQRAKEILVDLLTVSLDVVDPLDEGCESADQRLVSEERRAALYDCVERLAPRDQLLITLRFEEGATAAEVAKLMKFKTQHHVYRAENKVLATLRACVVGKGFGRTSRDVPPARRP